MGVILLQGCTSTPFGSFLKALAVLRLVGEQCDPEAAGSWQGDTFCLETKLTRDELLAFFIDTYVPTPVLAPWNGGSGFYPKDNKEGISAIQSTTGPRFREYREAIALCLSFPEVQEGKSKDDEDGRRTAILLRCRNQLSDRAVEWLDAATGIASDGSRVFAPVLGTGGNEGRLDYTNNFMTRLAALLIKPDAKTPVRALLGAALFGDRTSGLQSAASGQFDPGRAGGANQGPGIDHEAPTNPWDLVLTIEGAVAWASGIYRRQGTSYRKILCSPFTVAARTIGYGSSSPNDDARAEVWAPLWNRPVRYRELKTLLREGRASVHGRPATNTIEFAEAACSLGVDRGIDRFVRYSLLKRRGDSYVALPAGTFHAGYRSESDRIRELQTYLDYLDRRDLPKSAGTLRRGVESAVFQALLIGGADRMREVMVAFGRLIRAVLSTADSSPIPRRLPASGWLRHCGYDDSPEVRIAAALASIRHGEVGLMVDHLTRSDKRFAWYGANLPARLISILERRLQLAETDTSRPLHLAAELPTSTGDATLFVEGSVDDSLIEDLVFAFLALDWSGDLPNQRSTAETLPAYAVLKAIFTSEMLAPAEKQKYLRPDQRALSLLKAGRIEDATGMAVNRLEVAGLQPLRVEYGAGADSSRLAASLLIPADSRGRLLDAVCHHETKTY